MPEYTGFRPQSADENIPTLSLDQLLISRVTFFAQMRGYAMARAGIRPGDLLVIEPQDSYRDQQIVLAMVDRQAVVRKLERRSDGGFDLVAADPKYEARVISEDCIIRGRVVAFVRMLDRKNSPLPVVF